MLYASTHLAGKACPPDPDFSKGYVWKLYESFDLFSTDVTGGKLKRLTDNPGYDAEATLPPDGKTILFTSLRNGDLDLYTIGPQRPQREADHTHDLGYDRGAFFSRDGKRIVWRTSRPKTDADKTSYQELLRGSAIRPMNLEIWVANADGSNAKQVTSNGAANFGPYFFPDGKRIIFASNAGDPGGRNFDLWMVNDDGTGLERITYNDTFDGFPMFSPDGTTLVFASNRNAGRGTRTSSSRSGSRPLETGHSSIARPPVGAHYSAGTTRNACAGATIAPLSAVLVLSGATAFLAPQVSNTPTRVCRDRRAARDRSVSGCLAPPVSAFQAGSGEYQFVHVARSQPASSPPWKTSNE